MDFMTKNQKLINKVESCEMKHCYAEHKKQLATTIRLQAKMQKIVSEFIEGKIDEAELTKRLNSYVHSAEYRNSGDVIQKCIFKNCIHSAKQMYKAMSKQLGLNIDNADMATQKQFLDTSYNVVIAIMEHMAKYMKDMEKKLRNNK